MHLELDTIHEYEGLFGPGARCRIQIFKGEQGQTPVVIATDLPSSEGTAINNVAEQLAAEVLVTHLRDRTKEPEPLIWIERMPRGPSSTDQFAQVTFAHYQPVRFKGRWRIGPPIWRYMSAGEVEQLLGMPLAD
ncbi:hypothetical protein EPN52_02335 [bacterium]|nr:MAG: hypothetical protein EPN52_02335 [bacterium]